MSTGVEGVEPLDDLQGLYLCDVVCSAATGWLYICAEHGLSCEDVLVVDVTDRAWPQRFATDGP